MNARLACPAAAVAAILATWPALAGPPTITTLVLEGDSVDGVGLVTTIFNIAVNSNGDWLVEADTDNPDTDADSVLLNADGVFWRENDLLPAPNGATLNSFDSVTLNDLGQGGFNHFLSGTKGTNDDTAVYDFFDPGSEPFTGTIMLLQESNAAPGLPEGTQLIGFFDVKINNANQLWLVATANDALIGRALYIFDPDTDNGGFQGFQLVAAEGDLLPGQTEIVADFGTGPHQSAMNDSGDALFFADLQGSTATDGTIYLFDYDALDRLLVAQEGGDSPVKGRPWSLLSSPELDINNGGDIVYSGTLTGDAATASVLVKNDATFRQEGDPVPGLEAFALTSFGTGPLEINDNGGVVWYGDWDDANVDVDTGLFLDDQLLVQEGVTVLEGSVVDIVRGVEDGYHMSNNGRFIIFEAVLLDGREGAFLIDFGSDCPWDCGDGNGAVGTADLLALLAEWGTPGSCDTDGGGIGTSDLLKLLANWGACP